MTRKPIAGAVQNSILLKSRRRCCLCFWLEGRDEVLKGQIAHLDHNNENNAEDNLCFLCLDHHDEYDGSTRLAKGLKHTEVSHWRDELYKEMEYRFRSIKCHRLELLIQALIWFGEPDQFAACFELKNTGEVDANCPLVSVRLPDKVAAERARRKPERNAYEFVPPEPIPFFHMRTKVGDLFEDHGRMAVKDFHNAFVLHPDHSEQFFGLTGHLADFPLGSEIILDYRVDCRDAVPSKGQITARIPSQVSEFISWETLLKSQ